MKTNNEHIRFLIPATPGTYLLYKDTDTAEYKIWNPVLGWALDDGNITFPVTYEGVEHNAMSVMHPDGRVELAFEAVFDDIQTANEYLKQQIKQDKA